MTEVASEKNLGVNVALNTQYLVKQSEALNTYDHLATEFLKMSGVYWGVTALDLMGNLDKIKETNIIEFIKSCFCEKVGGFSAHPNHDPHIIYTLSAIQVLSIYNRLGEFDLDKISKHVASLQQPNGAFFGDKWGEIDVRFSFCAVAVLVLINRINVVDISAAINFVLACHNPDGGFGSKPHAESHAGLIYCCVGFLSITNQLHRIDCEKLSWWLCERQLLEGGFNGRPEKLPDVCYSWWVLASLTMMGKTNWINGETLGKFITSCQDSTTGGFSDRQDHLPDIFHTLFGIGALSLLKHKNLKAINPTFCMPQYVIDRMKIQHQLFDC